MIFLSNPHTLQTQFNGLAQHRHRLATPDTKTQHGSSGEQQRNLHRSLAVNSHFFFTLSLFLHLIIPLHP